MEEEKTLAIPLGGSTADGEQVHPTTGPVESAASGTPEPEQKSAKSQVGQSVAEQDGNKTPEVAGNIASKSDEPKKPGIVSRMFKALGALIIFLLVVSVIGGVVLLFLATRDEIPSAPEIKTDMKTVVTDSAWEAIKEKEIRLNSDEVNLFLSTVKEKSAEKAAEKGIEINDLFSVIAGDKATVYARIRYKGIVWPVKVVARMSFDDPNIIISIDKAYLGKINLPTDIIIDFVSDYIASDNISVYNGMIYYDTTEFNDKITEVTVKQLGLEVDESNPEDKSWWDKVKDWFKEKTANFVSDVIHDLKFKNVTIVDNEIVITVSYNEK